MRATATASKGVRVVVAAIVSYWWWWGHGVSAHGASQAVQTPGSNDAMERAAVGLGSCMAQSGQGSRRGGVESGEEMGTKARSSVVGTMGLQQRRKSGTVHPER